MDAVQINRPPMVRGTVDLEPPQNSSAAHMRIAKQLPALATDVDQPRQPT